MHEIVLSSRNQPDNRVVYYFIYWPKEILSENLVTKESKPNGYSIPAILNTLLKANHVWSYEQ